MVLRMRLTLDESYPTPLAVPRAWCDARLVDEKPTFPVPLMEIRARTCQDDMTMHDTRRWRVMPPYDSLAILRRDTKRVFSSRPIYFFLVFVLADLMP